MAELNGPSDAWRRAEGVADVNSGFAIGRHRMAKRVVAAVLRPFLTSQHEFNRNMLEVIVEVRNDLSQQIARVPENDIQRIREEIARSNLSDLAIEVRELSEKAEELFQNHGWAIDAIKEYIESNKLDRESINEHIDLLRDQMFARHHEGTVDLQSRLSEITQHFERTFTDLSTSNERQSRTNAELRSRLAQVDLLLDRVRGTLPTPTAQDLEPVPTRFDLLYGAFEDAFRGSEEVIKDRLTPYIEILNGTRVDGPVLDVGCGRGDLLALLQHAGIDAYGIELNTTYAPHWEANKLSVLRGDALDHLRNHQPGTLRAVMAIQVVEHMPIEVLLEFFDLSLTALASGGALIIETPNPANLIVGASTFYLDPTHTRPLPAELLAFLVESRGYSSSSVIFLDREGVPHLPFSRDQAWSTDLDPIRQTIDHYLFGPQDYALVARRV